MTGQTLSTILLDREALDPWDLAKVISTHYSLPFIDLEDLTVGQDEGTVLPVEFCAEHTLLPLDVFGAVFTVAVCEMPSSALLEEIIETAGKVPFLYVAVRRQLRDALDKLVLRAAKQGRKEAPARAAGSTKPRAAAPAPKASPAAAEATKAL